MPAVKPIHLFYSLSIQLKKYKHFSDASNLFDSVTGYKRSDCFRQSLIYPVKTEMTKKGK